MSLETGQEATLVIIITGANTFLEVDFYFILKRAKKLLFIFAMCIIH